MKSELSPRYPSDFVLRGSWGTRAEDFYKVFFRELEIGEFDIEALRFTPVQVLR